MEKELLACALHSRQDYELITEHIKVKDKTHTKEFQVVLTKIGEYYDRDKDAQSVSPEIIVAQLVDSVRSEKLASRLTEYIQAAVAAQPSVPNVRAVVLSAQRQGIADRLAAALVEGDTSKAKELMDEYNSLNEQEEEREDDDVLVGADIAALMEQEYDPTNVIRLYPEALNRRLDAGAKRGHHVTVFGMSNIGKTAFNVNLGSGIAHQGKRTMHLINEDRKEDLYIRYVSNLSGMDKHSIRDNPALAESKARANGLDNVVVIDIKPGSPAQIRHFIQKYKPDAVIVDQLRNLQVKADSRVNQLERAATEMRNIAKECNVLVISVTQAGDSGRDKLVLDGGDIDFSNVGIPAQADLLIGIGANDEYMGQELRMLTLIKNKIGAMEESFPVKINRPLSRYLNV